MLKIENSKYVVEINELGAELTHFVNKTDNYDLIWNDPDGSIWKRHAPILFPAIGRSNEGKYLINGKFYEMPQHGFTRDYFFDEVHQYSKTKVTLIQHATKETKNHFPFNYILSVTYDLLETWLRINFTVKNNDNATMPFSLGFHPGWAINDTLDNYELVLEGNDTTIAYYGVGPVPRRNGTIDSLKQANGQVIPLSYSFLDDGLVILDAHTVKYVTLKKKNDVPTLKIDISDFPYLTLWSPENKKAPFVCIEPFAGLPDKAGEPVDWNKKLGNTLLSMGEHKDFNIFVKPE